MEAGWITVPHKHQSLLRAEPSDVEVGLRGRRFRCRCNPRRKPLDGSRSAYLRPGTELLKRLFEPYEILSVTLEDGVIRSN